MTIHLLPSNQTTFHLLRGILKFANQGFHTPQCAFDQARLEFTYSVSCTMHDTSSEEWNNRTCLWADHEQNIQAALVSEGENQGEAFFITRLTEISQELITQVLTFGENRLAKQLEDGSKELVLRVPTHLTNLPSFLKAQGFNPAPWKEHLAEFKLDSNNPHYYPALYRSELPPQGYRLVVGKAATPELKGLCHSLAFGYVGEKVYEQRIVQGFTKLQAMPGYQEDLDFLLLDSKNQPATMMSFWFDKAQNWGSLEPAGTVPNYRRKGLGKWLIQEGVRRLNALGCTSIFCGTNQEFYLSSGFELVESIPIWIKKFSIPKE